LTLHQVPTFRRGRIGIAILKNGGCKLNDDVISLKLGEKIAFVVWVEKRPGWDRKAPLPRLARDVGRGGMEGWRAIAIAIAGSESRERLARECCDARENRRTGIGNT
jgi:hypothetical protein